LDLGATKFTIMNSKTQQSGFLIQYLTFIISGGTLLGMICYEIIKEYYLPNISKWQSHIITITVTVILVTFLSALILRKQEKLHQEITEVMSQANITAEHLIAVINSTGDAIICTDKKGIIRSWNPGAEKIFGVSKEKILNQSICRFVPPEIPNRIYDLIRQTSEGAVYQETAVFLKNDGSRIHLLFSATSIIASEGEDECIYIIGHDISVQVAREELLKMVNLKQHLLSAVSQHDVNNNLQVLMLNCSLLKELTTDPQIHNIASKIEKQSLLISNHLAFMKEYESLSAQVPMWDNAHDLFDRATAPFLESSVTIRNDLDNLEIYADPLIEKVLYNICHNTVTHGKNPTFIHASYYIDDENCILAIEDDGIGISKDIKERIFEKGFGHKSGLGLYLIREILSITNIAIRESGIPSEGARFELIIPAGKWQLVTLRENSSK